MKLSKCCNLPLGAITMTCPGCGKAHDMHGNLYPTPPTSTEVEEILEKHHLSVMEETIANQSEGQGNDETENNLNESFKQATQAIIRLIQQAYNDGYRKAKEDNEVC